MYQFKITCWGKLQSAWGLQLPNDPDQRISWTTSLFPFSLWCLWFLCIEAKAWGCWGRRKARKRIWMLLLYIPIWEVLLEEEAKKCSQPKSFSQFFPGCFLGGEEVGLLAGFSVIITFLYLFSHLIVFYWYLCKFQDLILTLAFFLVPCKYSYQFRKDNTDISNKSTDNINVILNPNNDVHEFSPIHDISTRSAIVVLYTSEVYQRCELPKTRSGEFPV